MARTLERQWEEALPAEQALQAEHERFLTEQPACLSAEQREAIRRLAQDIPALWHDPTTTPAERQAIVRQLVERVIATVQGDSERVDVQIHWRGGNTTAATITRPVARLDQLSYYPQLAERLRALHGQGCANTTIANMLNAQNWRPAKRRQSFNAAMVSVMMARLGLQSRQRTPATAVERQANKWTLAELAHKLDMPQPTLRAWLLQGQLEGRKVTSQSHQLWLIQATVEDVMRLRSRRAAA